MSKGFRNKLWWETLSQGIKTSAIFFGCLWDNRQEIQDWRIWPRAAAFRIPHPQTPRRNPALLQAERRNRWSVYRWPLVSLKWVRMTPVTNQSSPSSITSPGAANFLWQGTPNAAACEGKAKKELVPRTKFDERHTKFLPGLRVNNHFGFAYICGLRKGILERQMSQHRLGKRARFYDPCCATPGWIAPEFRSFTQVEALKIGPDPHRSTVFWDFEIFPKPRRIFCKYASFCDNNIT